MYSEIKAEQFRELFKNSKVIEFSKKLITQSYVEGAPSYEGAMQELLEQSFAILDSCQADDQRFQAAVKFLYTELFRKQDPTFWFNRVYKHYKRDMKPQRRFINLKRWLVGNKVLDMGCGNGMTSVVLNQNGHQVYLTDVLDYRDEAARSLTFVPMPDPATIPYPDHAVDTAIVFGVLHHIEPANQNKILSELKRVSRRVIIEEDCYEVPSDLEGVTDAVKENTYFQEFMALPSEDQLRFLLFLDYFGNIIAQGIPQMNIPFEFKTVREWQEIFTKQGFSINKTFCRGFQAGLFNRSCHVLFVLDTCV